MYTDYPIVHESVVVNTFAIVASAILLTLVIVFYIFVLGRIFKKSGRNPLASIIPFYNLYVLLEILDLPRINIILFFIPIVNLYTILSIDISLVERFDKSGGYGAFLFFLPFIAFPHLALSSSKYVGINNEKVKEVKLDDKIVENVMAQETKIIERNTNVNMGSSIKEENNQDVTELKADLNVLDESRKTVNMDYIECPNCHNKVKKGMAVCFFCGANLKNMQNKEENETK